jgi:membrane-bound metal-dependent hydrolase YbcI (DUF457 family)
LPFTVSHAAAVLPLHRISRHQLPLSALMIGSMAPDFGYFFSRAESRQLTHSFIGLFTFSLPMGLLIWLFYIALLEKATITLLPDRWHTRFAHTDAITPRLLVRAAIAIILGAITHILWDAFTHRGTFVTNNLPWLLDPVPGISWLPIYHLLQGLSSVFGLWVLARWARHLHRQPARSLIRPYRISERARICANWCLLVAALLGALLEWLPYSHAGYDDQWFTVAAGLMSGFFIAWCCVAIAMWINARLAARVGG